MLNLKTLFFISTLTLAFSAIAYDNPLDFEYSASGNSGIRPTLIFNDGVDTYIQLLPNQTATGDVSKIGSYYVVKGVPKSFNVLVNGQPVSIQHIDSPIKKNNEVKDDDIKYEGALKNGENDFVIKKGETLSSLVKKYCKQKGIAVTWDSSSDFLVKKNIRITGDVPHIMLIDYLKSLGYEAGGSSKNIFVMDKFTGVKK